MRKQFASRMATKFQQLLEASEDIEMEWLLFRTAMILSVVKSCGRKRLRMASCSEKRTLGGTKTLRKLSEQKKMLLKLCCKTGHHLICNPDIPRHENQQLRQQKCPKNTCWRFKKSYGLPFDLLQYRRENSAEYLYS